MRAYTVGAGLVLFLFTVASATAETLNCRSITSVPVTISRPGIYCLTSNLTSGNATISAIIVDADNVVLDLNGWKLAAGPNNQSAGVASSQRRNVTVKNGTVTGFRTGISLLGNNHVVEGIRVDVSEGGIGAIGDSNIIRHNHVVAVRRSTGLAWGMYVEGRRNVILNNDVADVTAPDDNGVGIVLSNFSGTGTDFLVVNNRISSVREGIRFEHGATGKYRDNLTSGVVTPFVGGTDAGGNS